MSRPGELFPAEEPPKVQRVEADIGADTNEPWLVNRWHCLGHVWTTGSFPLFVELLSSQAISISSKTGATFLQFFAYTDTELDPKNDMEIVQLGWRSLVSARVVRQRPS